MRSTSPWTNLLREVINGAALVRTVSYLKLLQSVEECRPSGLKVGKGRRRLAGCAPKDKENAAADGEALTDHVAPL